MARANDLPDIDVTKLSLGDLEPFTENVNTFRRRITYDGDKLVLTNMSEGQTLLIITQGGYRFVLLQPSSWLRRQLRILDGFVKEKLNVTDNPTSEGKASEGKVYKSLTCGAQIKVIMSPFLKLYEYQDIHNGEYHLNPDVKLSQGTYTVDIEIPHIYYGPHRNGEQACLSIRVSQIFYRPHSLVSNCDSDEGEDIKPSIATLGQQLTDRKAEKRTYK